MADLRGHANPTITLKMYGNPRELHRTGEKPQVAWWEPRLEAGAELRLARR